MQAPGPFAAAPDAAPIGDDLAATIWTTDRQDDCGASGRECDGRGGALLSRVVGPAGLRATIRVASGGTISPTLQPLSGGKVLLAWEQLGSRGATSTWRARLIGATGTTASWRFRAGTVPIRGRLVIA